ncbi:LysR [Bartonella choladocola]|uniref:DNA-binding transcriptional regulator, LysR family n=2 Tax=Bartonellaceae TaxID=772 RepID=A0A1U9MF17_9HYPH|nr:DNA-binding transcriptional regulator, LysR family [Bartonella choladocola]
MTPLLRVIIQKQWWIILICCAKLCIMNWDDLKIFLAVARKGQLLSAAKLLSVNHTTVARRLTALEDELKTQLVVRRTTGCDLTASGEELLVRAEKIEAELLLAQEQLGGKNINLAGHVRIAAPDGFGVSFLAPRLNDILLRYPDLVLQLVPMPRSFSLSQREADIAITVERPRHGRLIARKLVDYRLGLYAHRNYIKEYGLPERIEELKAHHLISYVEDLVASQALAYNDEISRDFTSNFQISSTLGQLEAARSGAGIAVLHSYIAQNYNDLIPVLPDHKIERAYWLSYHESARNIRRVSEVASMIAVIVQKNRSLFE